VFAAHNATPAHYGGSPAAFDLLPFLHHDEFSFGIVIWLSHHAMLTSVQGMGGKERRKPRARAAQAPSAQVPAAIAGSQRGSAAGRCLVPVRR
jgi:hypothetical protein